MLVDCPQCGPVEHEPIPDDEDHCGCVNGWVIVDDGFQVQCACECHGTGMPW